MTHPKCMDCHFFQRDPKNLTQGHCHKNVPHVTVIPTAQGIMTLASFPPVKEDEWCGEHKLKSLYA